MKKGESQVKKHVQGTNEGGQWGGDFVWEQDWMGSGRAMEGKCDNYFCTTIKKCIYIKEKREKEKYWKY